MTPDEHALLSASGASKWLHCTPSARLEETLPESTSTYAEEGRIAHSIAELKLRKALIDPIGPKKFTTALKALQAHEKYDPEMLSCTDTYVEYIQGVTHGYAIKPYVIAEKRVDYSAYAPEGFGTADCLVVGGDTLHVIDYKHGKGVPVFAEDNPQMKLYALGAVEAYKLLYSIKRIVMVIIQPRLDSISECEISIDELQAWGEGIKPIAQMAFNGEGVSASGEWCRFCRAKALCRARSERHLSLEEEFGLAVPPLLSNDEVGVILLKAKNIHAWVDSLEEYALATVLSGGDIPGWKAVAGRGARKFEDTDKAFKAVIDAGYKEDLLYNRKPITLTEVEKLMGKKDFNATLKEQIIMQQGKPTLAELSDSREPYQSTQPTADDDFKQEKE